MEEQSGSGIKLEVLKAMQVQIHAQMIYWTQKYHKVSEQIELLKLPYNESGDTI